MNTDNFNLETIQAGDCGSDSCGSMTHTDTFQVGSCDCGNSGCFSHKEILMA